MRQLCVVAVVLTLAGVVSRDAAATSDPLVLCSCTASVVVGWTNPNDCAQPLTTADAGWASAETPLAAPTQDFDQAFAADAGSYHVWLRLRALADSKYNDAVWVQFGDAVDGGNRPIYPIGTTSGLLVNLATTAAATSLRGWGWQDGAYWLTQATTITFTASGPHTIRVQTREDGVSVDQVVLSPVKYLSASPGVVTNDSTRLVCTATPSGAAPPPPAAPGAITNPAPAAGASAVATSTSLQWTASANATSYDVALGTTNPPPMVATNQASTAYQPAGLTSGTTYFWRVDAKGAGGTTTGVLWTFTTAAAPPPTPAPGAPSGALPADGSTSALTTVAVNWSPSSNASSYAVSFGTTNPPPVVATGVTGTSYQPQAALAYSTTYYWKVNAIGSGGTTAGAIWRFTTVAAPAPPTPPADAPPAGSTSLARLRVFDWNVAQGYNPIDNVNDYNLQIDLIASFNPDVVTLQEMSYSDADMMTLFIKRPERADRPAVARDLSAHQRGNHADHQQHRQRDSDLAAGRRRFACAHRQRSRPSVRGAAGAGDGERHARAPVDDASVRVGRVDSGGADRLAAVVAFTEGADRIVTGDFNAYPGESTTWTPAWTTAYADAWTTATSWVQATHDSGYTFDKRTATGNPERIDYQWTAGVTVSEMFVVKTRRSDHHALVTDYKVP